MTLNVRLVSAQLTHDTQTFSNMDPYCLLQLGHQKKRSRTKQEAGKKPVWNESFMFYGQDNNLTVTVMDEDVVTDDVVGNGTVNISKFRGSTVEMQEVVQLYYQGKTAGKVLMMISGGTGGTGGSYQQPMNNMNSMNNMQQMNPISNMNANMFQVYNYAQTMPQQQPYNPYQQPQQQWGQPNVYGNQPYVPPQSNNSSWGDTSLNNGWGNFNPGAQNVNYNQPPVNNNINPLNVLGGIFQNNMNPQNPPPPVNSNNLYPSIAGGMGGLIKNNNNNYKNPYG